MQYDDTDREILRLLQGDIPLETRPFRYLAERLNNREEDIVGRLKAMKKQGIIRRVGAVLRHQKAGFTVNAMVAWKVPAEGEDEAGAIMAGYAQISHCYLREVPPEFGYRLFTMIHTKSEQELSGLLDDISGRTGIADYIVLKSIKELKKQSMKYLY
ncbi:MAG: Lrp/AsnC family transcriptional regulator [Syntrophomonas sp.]